MEETNSNISKPNKVDAGSVVLLVIPVVIVLFVLFDMYVLKSYSKPGNGSTFSGEMLMILVILSPILLIISLVAALKSKITINKVLYYIASALYLAVLFFIWIAAL